MCLSVCLFVCLFEVSGSDLIDCLVNMSVWNFENVSWKFECFPQFISNIKRKYNFFGLL